MGVSRTIPWKPFSKKHRSYIKRAIKGKRMCVAEGAIRSGKTIDHCIIAAAYLEKCPDRIHLASGSSVANAKLNIGDCNGFGLEHIFRGRCRWGKHKDNEALFIQTQSGEKILIFAGGGKANSYKRILGNSYGLWIATEVNEHYDSEDSQTSFIKVAFGRQAAALEPFTLWDLNPSTPQHSIYTEYIDSYRERLGDRYLYERFTMNDNLSIAEEQRAEIASQYIEGSVWYRRDILGERVTAEGLVYQQFADNEQDYLIDVTQEHLRDVAFVSIGIDFGGTKSLTTFVATAIHQWYKKVTVLADYHIKGRKGDIDANRLCNEFIGFIQRLQTKYPSLYIKYVFADSEAQYLINSLRRVSPISIRDSKKKRITSRIIAATTLFNTNRLYLSRDCGILRGGLRGAVWDKKKPDTRLDNFSSDIDILDAFEYSWEPFMNKLCPNMRGK